MNELSLNPDLESALPFEKERQYAFLGHVMTNDRFFLQIKEQVKASWFVDGYIGKLYDAYVKFWDKYHRTPQSSDEFMMSEDIRSLNPADRIKVNNVEKESRAQAQRFGLDVFRQELTDWMRCRIYHKTVSESAKLFNGKQINKAVIVLENAVKEFQQTRFDGAPPADFSSPRSLVEQQKIDTDNALTTGVPLLDRHILADGVNGSLLAGDTTVIIAPQNIGKTTTMQTIARHNLANNKSVLFFTLEGRQLDIMEKFYQCVLKVNRAEFRRMTLSEDPKDVAMVNWASAKLHRDLTYVSMNKTGITVEEVIAAIRGHQNRRIALTGKGYDLLVVDYPAICTTAMAHAGQWPPRMILDYVYRQFVQLAGEEKFHALLASQSNREGAKINRNYEQDDNRLLTPEDIGEGYGPTQSATNILTINRDPRAQAANRITFYLCKSRSGSVGWAVCCRSDFTRALTHGPDMLATAYNGTTTMADKIEKYLTQYNGRDIPAGYA